MRAASLPRFPSIVRDLSVLVDSTLPAAAVRGTIRSAAPSLLARVIEFDRYRGKGVPDGRVSQRREDMDKNGKPDVTVDYDKDGQPTREARDTAP